MDSLIAASDTPVARRPDAAESRLPRPTRRWRAGRTRRNLDCRVRHLCGEPAGRGDGGRV